MFPPPKSVSRPFHSKISDVSQDTPQISINPEKQLIISGLEKNKFLYLFFHLFI